MIWLLHVFALFTYTYAQQGSVGCVLKEVYDNPRMFQVDIPIVGIKQFPCPTNTMFDAKQCGCGWVDNPINPPPFDGTGFGGADATTLPPVSTTRPPCRLRSHTDRHFYDEFVTGLDWMTRRCPMGTLFNQEACACHDLDPNQIYTCHPQFWMNFNGQEIKDSAGYQISIGNNSNVDVVSNAGRFDGTGTLTVWQYANQDLGTELTINLRFYEFPGGVSEEQVLMSNCYGRRLGSVEIAINQNTKEVIFRADAMLSEGVELRLPYREKSWKNTTLIYNGQELTAIVDEEITSAPLKGHLASRYNGFLIGSCNGRGYVGYIDDLRIYRCLVDGLLDNAGNANNGMGTDMQPRP